MILIQQLLGDIEGEGREGRSFENFESENTTRALRQKKRNEGKYIPILQSKIP
jgi:hypothetical protein